ncbi:hypothetical protein CRE_07653 [Caenorhabditis remanei]|uniref:Uncharacterized protein n=1 Tax=Caenorhabditis remanei TaxID=31234 RepID=E3MP40_CAERE|nr:hypothetical protein CRE_07653 [Caenorhabditis remanei]
MQKVQKQVYALLLRTLEGAIATRISNVTQAVDFPEKELEDLEKEADKRVKPFVLVLLEKNKNDFEKHYLERGQLFMRQRLFSVVTKVEQRCILSSAPYDALCGGLSSCGFSGGQSSDTRLDKKEKEPKDVLATPRDVLTETTKANSYEKAISNGSAYEKKIRDNTAAKNSDVFYEETNFIVNPSSTKFRQNLC